MEKMIIKMETGMHWGKEVDDETGKFIRWVSDPSKKPYKDICLEWLEKAESMNNNMFVQSLRKQFDKKHTLSPKQVDACRQIYERAEFA